MGAALLLSLLTYISFQYYKERQSCKLSVLASLGEGTSPTSPCCSSSFTL